jgi:hypothetical protein
MHWFNIYGWLASHKTNPLSPFLSRLVTKRHANKYRKQFNAASNVSIPIAVSPQVTYLDGVEGNTSFVQGITALGEIIHGSFGFKGTCGLVHCMPGLLEKICFLAGAQRAYITIGCVHDVIKGITLFDDSPRDPSLMGNLLRLQGNYHAWITLDSGEIVDLTFAGSFAASEHEFIAILGPPFQADRFVYEPYQVIEFFPGAGVDEHTIAQSEKALCGPGWEDTIRAGLRDYLETIRITAPDVFAFVQTSFRTRFPQYGRTAALAAPDSKPTCPAGGRYDPETEHC